jgi:hypothetical protein
MDGMKFTIDGSIKGSKHIASMEYYMDLLSEWIDKWGNCTEVIQPGLSRSAIPPPPSGCYKSSPIPPPPTSHFLAAVEISDPISILSTSGCCPTVTYSGCRISADPTSILSSPAATESAIPPPPTLYLSVAESADPASPAYSALTTKDPTSIVLLTLVAESAIHLCTTLLSATQSGRSHSTYFLTLQDSLSLF